MDDLFSKTLMRLQLGPDDDPRSEQKPQRRLTVPVPAAKSGRRPRSPPAPPAASEPELSEADPLLRGWAQKVLLTGPSPAEIRQDLLEIVDTTLEARRPAPDQAAGSGTKFGAGRQPAWRPPEISPGADEDCPAAPPRTGTAGGSGPSGLPPAPFTRSTQAALQEGRDPEVAAVFREFAKEYEIESGELIQALLALGHRRPREQWVEEMLDTSYSGRSYLDKGEFAEFVEAYRARFLADISEKYQASDLHSNGSVSMSDLSTMLRHEGITPLPGMVRELFNELVHGGGGAGGGGMVGFEEYLRVNDIVHERGGFTRAALVRLHATFGRFDGDADGRLTDFEVKAALRWLGLEAFADEALKECKKEATSEGKGGVSQADFLLLVSRCHESEVGAVNTAFVGHDKSLTGSVDIRDLPAIFMDLGYTAVTPQLCKEACAACSSQGGSAVTPSAPGGGESGDQMAVRRVTSGWGKARMSFMGLGRGEHGEPDAANALTLVQMMDSPSGTSSSLQWRRIPKQLLFEDFYAVVGQVRDTHCLSCAERTEAVEAFELHAESKAQGISLVEMAKAVRWIGYPVHLGRLLEIFDETDMHDTYRPRDAQEFMRLVARLRADEVSCARARMKTGPPHCTCDRASHGEDSDACDHCLSEKWGCGIVLASTFGVLLGELGHFPSWEQVSHLEDTAGGKHARVPLWTALQLLEQHRRDERGRLRSNQSFSDGEVRRFEQSFQRLEGGMHGAVKRRDIVAAVDDIVGRKRRCKRLSAVARDVLQKLDPPQSGEARPSLLLSSPARVSLHHPPSPARASLHPPSPAHSDAPRGRRSGGGSMSGLSDAPPATAVGKVDLPEFLNIMRMLHDQDDQERLEKEQSIVREVGFSREEVREFRRLFHQASFDGEHRLTLPELEKLVARVMPVTTGMQRDLKSMAMKAAGIVDEEAMDFGSFLAVMRSLVDKNWHNINEASETALAAAKAKASSRTGS